MHTTDIAATGSTTSDTALRVERVRHVFAAHHLQLQLREVVSPGFVRITLAGADLTGFRSDGFDDHIKFLLPQPGQDKPGLPQIVDGRPQFDGERPVARDYTPVRWDAAKGQLVLEFALHDHGPAAEWARTAQIGQWAGVAGPRGSMVIPAGFAWHWLLGDDSALPAVERRLAELPATARVTVRLKVAAADRRPLPSAAQVDLQWVDDLAEAAAALPLPSEDGYIWAAGEHNDMAALRTVFKDKGASPKRMRISAYWKRGQADHHEELVQE
ncbi:siderophore-interacting protein [Comamonas terrigena]|uniref:siderophore-interacting protein n=1 Tax=Comamonas terrigena TaxID=32013 RepID=UPI002446BD56|nr:siderophore-interacting protein [Comamonas terrigena]MDH1292957.1 siderophore-interacting protein [Comamonas terrigena]